MWPGNVFGPVVLPVGDDASMGFDYDDLNGWTGPAVTPQTIDFYQRSNSLGNLFRNNEVRHHLANVRRD